MTTVAQYTASFTEEEPHVEDRAAESTEKHHVPQGAESFTQKCFSKIPYSVVKKGAISDEYLTKRFGKNASLVDRKELESLRAKYISGVIDSKEVIKAERNRRMKLTMLKIALIMTAFGAVIVCHAFGLHTGEYNSALSLALIPLSIAFLVWG